MKFKIGMPIVCRNIDMLCEKLYGTIIDFPYEDSEQVAQVEVIDETGHKLKFNALIGDINHPSKEELLEYTLLKLANKSSIIWREVDGINEQRE